LEGLALKWRHLAVTALALLLLAGGARLTAEQKKGRATGHDRRGGLAGKLGLTSEQKEKLHKIDQEFDQKEDPLEDKIRELRHEEHQAVWKVLTPEQREKAPGVMREAMEKELREVGDRLGLSDQQKERIHKVRAEYDRKIDQAAEKGGRSREQVRHLRQEEFAAIRKELTDAQRAKLPGIFREEAREWRDPAVRRDRLKALADKLDLSESQKKQIQQIHAKHDPEVSRLQEQLRDLHKHEHEAMGKVLTEDQRKKLHELREGRGGRSKTKS